MDGVMFMHSRRLIRLREVLDDGVTVGRVKRITAQFSFLGGDDFYTANIRARGHRDARTVDQPQDLALLLAGLAEEGDYVVCLGAGNITQWAATLPAEIGAIIGKPVQ